MEGWGLVLKLGRPFVPFRGLRRKCIGFNNVDPWWPHWFQCGSSFLQRGSGSMYSIWWLKIAKFTAEKKCLFFKIKNQIYFFLGLYKRRPIYAALKNGNIPVHHVGLFGPPGSGPRMRIQPTKSQCGSKRSPIWIRNTEESISIFLVQNIFQQ